MKNIKKTLALVLVLVLALGMVPFAVAGPASKNVDDFSDFDDIEYKEAVDVLTALGVITGRDDGNFDPTATIVRSEAAKIISYVLLGTARADALSKSPSTFTDVPNDHWANPFIQYCYREGIILGYGDGRFGPNDPVTGTQMAKMLLMAMGYGTQGEFSGSGWEHAVITRGGARDVRVLWGTGNPDYTRPATREEIAMYTFNSLWRRSMVSWNSILNDYSSWTNIAQTGDPRPTLGFNTFGLVGVADEDDFGFTGRHWRLQNGRILTEFYNTAIVLGSFTAGAAHTQNNLARDYIWDEDDNIDVYVNGSRLSNLVLGVTVTGLDFEVFALRGGTARPFTYGTHVSLLDTNENGEINRVIIQYEVLAQVASVDSGLGTIRVNLWDFNNNVAAARLSGVTLEAEGLVKDDYVAIAPANGAVTTLAGSVAPDYTRRPISINKAGLLTATAGDIVGDFRATRPGGDATYPSQFHTVALDGTAISLSYGIGLGFGLSNVPSQTADSTFYLDSFGAILGYRSATPALRAAGMDYIYVEASAYEAPKTQGTNAVGTLLVSGWTTTGEYLDAIQIATFTHASQTHPYVLRHNAPTNFTSADVWGVGGSSYTGNGPISVNATDRGFNDVSARQLRGQEVGGPAANTEGRWYSYTMNEAKDRIMLREIRGNGVTQAMTAVGTGADATGDNNPLVDTAQLLQRVSNGLSVGGTTRLADGSTLLTTVAGGTVTNSTGISNFTSSGFRAYAVGADAGGTDLPAKTNYRAWLVVYAETGTSTAQNPATTATLTVAKVFMVTSGSATLPRTVGVVMGAPTLTASGYRYNVLRADGTTDSVVVGTYNNEAFVDSSSLKADAGAIVSTAETSKSGIYEMYPAPLAPQGSYNGLVESFSAAGGSLTVNSGGSQNLFVNEDTIYVRNERAGVWAPGSQPQVGSATQRADTITVWYRVDTGNNDNKIALAVVSSPGAQRATINVAGIDYDDDSTGFTVPTATNAAPAAGVGDTPFFVGTSGYTVTSQAWTTGVTAGVFDATGTATFQVVLTAANAFTFAGTDSVAASFAYAGANVTVVAAGNGNTLTITYTWNIA